jgi:hypothetical protein
MSEGGWTWHNGFLRAFVILEVGRELSWKIHQEDTMKATKRAKATRTKSKGIKKGKSLSSVKPLTKLMDAPPTENISLPFTKIEFKYN